MSWGWCEFQSWISPVWFILRTSNCVTKASSVYFTLPRNPWIVHVYSLSFLIICQFRLPPPSSGLRSSSPPPPYILGVYGTWSKSEWKSALLSAHSSTDFSRNSSSSSKFVNVGNSSLQTFSQLLKPLYLPLPPLTTSYAHVLTLKHWLVD